MAERMLAVMDAEHGLPPVLQLAFAREPRALEGWNGMSPLQRRNHLFGIFYYRTPEPKRAASIKSFKTHPRRGA